ncbi:C6 transcription factor Prf [Echinococcus multilocularis]|uniref:C6 transcription factor Prf n=1 Tax=Echinococcus multilocularis TaxID=6211 RepID=A0A0S4MRL0_ECHMU|nr:C6 transcription factor Prf [Echinococcus multilocularis]
MYIQHGEGVWTTGIAQKDSPPSELFSNMGLENAHFVSTGAYATMRFSNIFAGKGYATLSAFGTDMDSFMAFKHERADKMEMIFGYEQPIPPLVDHPVAVDSML